MEEAISKPKDSYRAYVLEGKIVKIEVDEDALTEIIAGLEDDNRMILSCDNEALYQYLQEKLQELKEESTHYA